MKEPANKSVSDVGLVGLTSGHAPDSLISTELRKPRRRGGAPGRAPKEQASMQHQGTRRRRVAVKGHRGVYYRIAASGRRVYEITYADSEGRRRWQVVPGNL